jgi:hypothetical protein
VKRRKKKRRTQWQLMKMMLNFLEAQECLWKLKMNALSWGVPANANPFTLSVLPRHWERLRPVSPKDGTLHAHLFKPSKSENQTLKMMHEGCSAKWRNQASWIKSKNIKKETLRRDTNSNGVWLYSLVQNNTSKIILSGAVGTLARSQLSFRFLKK